MSTKTEQKIKLDTSDRHLQLSGKQSAHFGHMVVITVNSVIHLFFAILPFAWTVWRRPSYVGHASGQGGCPGLICGKRESAVDVIKLNLDQMQLQIYKKLISKMFYS